MARTRRVVLSLVTWWILAAPALAQWSPDPILNNPVTIAPFTQGPVVAVSDGAGGAIFVWRNEDFDGTAFVYGVKAQRISAVGVVQWAVGGVTVVASSLAAQATLLRPPIAAVADGSGGAIVAWRDNRNPPDTGDIYAQRLNGAGAAQWTAGGVAIVTATDLQQRPVLVADGSGGAIIAWEDRRNGVGSTDIFAQRINGGAVQWAANGVAVSAATGDQLLPVITTDGSSGAIVAWTDIRSVDGEIFAQKILAAGTPSWTADGVALTSLPGSIQNRPAIATDNQGGAHIAWEDTRNGADNDIYARRIASAGTPQWAANGVQIAGTANATIPIVVADLAAGAFIVWTDERNVASSNTDVFAQRVNGGGIVQWAANGVTVCGATGAQLFPAAAADGSGGVVIGWEDGRSGPGDVFAQRYNVGGAALWNADGRPVSTAANGQGGVTVALDGSGGGVFAWSDSRAAATGVDVFAAHVDGSGGLPVTLESFTIE